MSLVQLLRRSTAPVVSSSASPLAAAWTSGGAVSSATPAAAAAAAAAAATTTTTTTTVLVPARAMSKKSTKSKKKRENIQSQRAAKQMQLEKIRQMKMKEKKERDTRRARESLNAADAKKDAAASARDDAVERRKDYVNPWTVWESGERERAAAAELNAYSAGVVPGERRSYVDRDTDMAAHTADSVGALVMPYHLDPAYTPSTDAELERLSNRRQRASHSTCAFSLGIETRNLEPMNFPFLLKFMGEFGAVQPRRVTGLSKYHQRRVARTIERARGMGLFVYKKGFGVVNPFRWYYEQERVAASRPGDGQGAVDIARRRAPSRYTHDAVDHVLDNNELSALENSTTAEHDVNLQRDTRDPSCPPWWPPGLPYARSTRELFHKYIDDDDPDVAALPLEEQGEDDLAVLSANAELERLDRREQRNRIAQQLAADVDVAAVASSSSSSSSSLAQLSEEALIDELLNDDLADERDERAMHGGRSPSSSSSSSPPSRRSAHHARRQQHAARQPRDDAHERGEAFWRSFADDDDDEQPLTHNLTKGAGGGGGGGGGGGDVPGRV